jgi:5-(carboxyamino)imidazole ribonucleotide mutase
MSTDPNFPKVAIIMGSDSDYPVMEQAELILKQFQVPYTISIVSAHRTPDKMMDFSKTALQKGYKAIIAGAGGSAHLPGMVAAMTTVPVIGVPVLTKTLSGVDSLYSIVQMPGGIPVATVAINGAKNAGLLAVQILSMFDPELSKEIQEYRENLKLEVEEKSRNLFGV